MKFTRTVFLLTILFSFGTFTAVNAQKGNKPKKEKAPKEKKDKSDKSGNSSKGGDKPMEFKGTPAKILEQADYYYSLAQYTTAKAAYVEVLRKDPTNHHATFRVARCSYYIQDYEDAARYYESALEIDKNANDTVYFELGMTYRLLDRHNDAFEEFTEFRKRWKYKDDYYKMCKVQLNGCKEVEKWKTEPEKWTTKCADLNTAAGDMFPSILRQTGNEDNAYIIWTSHQNSAKGNESFAGANEMSRSDLYMAKIEDDSTFSVAENLGKPINTDRNDGSSAFSPDGMTMYYSICGMGKMGFGCTIYEAKYDPRKKSWGKPKIVEPLRGIKEVVISSNGKTKKVGTYDVQPSLSADGNTMFFTSDRGGGIGKLDIWYATKEGETWSAPKNLGNKINTPFNETSPHINASDSRLYFASDGHVGWGGLDLYYTEGSIGSWGEPKNMGAPINSTYDDYGGVWMKNDSLTYFTSNRPGCSGRDDIYIGKAKEKDPIQVSVHGVVRDKRSKQAIPFATVMIYQYDLDNELIPIDTFRTGQDGEYNFPLEVRQKYLVVGNAPEYLVAEEKFDTDVDETKVIEKNLDIELELIILDNPIVLENIYYDFDSATLRPESRDRLIELADLLNTNPHITIQIGSHTDSNGSEEYNKELSERRAISVVKYLTELGINGMRLSWFGYGETKLLIYPELTDIDEQLNRRTEFQIKDIEFKAQ
jgi:peptidoglycan-associated lipoprotein